MYGRPDLAIVSVTARKTSNTSEAAVASVKADLSSVLMIARENGILDDDFNTQTFNVYPEYNYINNTAVITGQTATSNI